jgi:hypothetical protein
VLELLIKQLERDKKVQLELELELMINLNELSLNTHLSDLDLFTSLLVGFSSLSPDSNYILLLNSSNEGRNPMTIAKFTEI